VQDRSAEAVEAGDLQRVTVTQDSQGLVELRATGFRAAGVVDVDVRAVDPGPLERGDLVVGVLFGG
jgi:hypothetical protein